MNVLVCPDKFKSSLTAVEACLAIVEGLPTNFNIHQLPLADGGEGSLQAISTCINGFWQEVEVKDPLLRNIKSKYYCCEQRAYIEMALASGLQLLTPQQRNPLKTTTFGTGQLIQHALQKEYKQICLFIGGSATNDGGIGMAAALGFIFINEKGQKLLPIGENLQKINQIIIPFGFQEKIKKIKFIVACDVDNVLTGPNGAAQIYGRQKGATEQAINQLDRGLNNLDKVFKKCLCRSVKLVKGSGAAGGLGGGALVFLNATIKSGARYILQIVKFEELLKKTDLVITGEGKFDNQTLNGKIVFAVLNLAKQYQVKSWVVCGICEIQSPKISCYCNQIIQLNQSNTNQISIKNAHSIITQRIKHLVKHMFL